MKNKYPKKNQGKPRKNRKQKGKPTSTDNLKKQKVYLIWNGVFGIGLLCVILMSRPALAIETAPVPNAWLTIINAVEQLKKAGCVSVQTHQTTGFSNIKSETGNAILTRGGEYLTECMDPVNTDSSSSGADPTPAPWLPVGAVDAGNADWAYVESGTKGQGSQSGGFYAAQRYQNDIEKDLIYTLPVLPGEYKVMLHFEETWSGAFEVGKRVFGVIVNGVTIEPALDIFARVGANTPFVVEAVTTDIGGEITIQLQRQVQNPTIAGIELFSQNAAGQLLEPVVAKIQWQFPRVDAGGNPETPANITGFDVQLCPMARQCWLKSVGPVNEVLIELIPGPYRITARTHARNQTSQWSGPVLFEVAL